METDSGKFVTKEYLKAGRSMREFEQKVGIFEFYFYFV
jgi:hypothetical protein